MAPRVVELAGRHGLVRFDPTTVRAWRGEPEPSGRVIMRNGIRQE